MLLNIFGEDGEKKLWDNIGNLYNSNSLVIKLLVQSKLYHLRMNDGKYVENSLNAFNDLVIQLASIILRQMKSKISILSYFVFCQTLRIIQL